MSERKVHHVRLDSGMKLLLMPNPSNPTVSIQLSIAGGSDTDPQGKGGLSNFARALLTKGTVKSSAAKIAERIDALGMEIGFGSGRHSVTMGARVLKDHVEPAFKLITEVLSLPAPPEDEAERMRQRIITAIKQQADEPAAVAMDNLRRMVYGKRHPYGRPTEGDIRAVKSIALSDILSFYEERLLPGAVVGAVVGDLDAEAIADLAARTIGRWKGGGEHALVAPKTVSLPAEPQERRIGMPGKTQSEIALGFQGIKRLDPDYHALSVGNISLGRLSLGGRVGRRIRDEEGMAYYAYTSFDSGVGAGPFVFRAGVNPANVDRAVELALEELGSAKSSGLTPEEVEEAVLFLGGSIARQVETNGGMASTLLMQEIFGLGDDYYLRLEPILEALTREQVNEALATHLHPDRYCLVVAGPDA